MCGKTVPARDSGYEIGYPATRSLIREISHRGHEICLSPSLGTFRDREGMVREVARLRLVCSQEGVNQEEWRSRMRYLRRETPTTAHGLSAADMAYDSTLGFAEQPGLLCGTCYQYPMFDPVAGRVINLCAPLGCHVRVRYVEQLFESRPSGWSFAGVQEDKRRLSSCRGGAFALLLHNSEIVSGPQHDFFRPVLDA